MKDFKLKLLLVCVLALFVGAPVALGDWNPGDGHKMHYPQLPDLADTGIDVDISYCGPAGDDFECTAAGPITDVHIWGSWLSDEMPMGDPNAVDFIVEIWSNNPMGPMGYSEPNEPLWGWFFSRGDFDVRLYAGQLYEGYYMPCEMYVPDGDTMCWQYNFYIDPCDAFPQEEGEIYWLVVHAMPYNSFAFFGWKTSLDHWMDDAVTVNWYPPPEWYELRYPIGYGHPFEGQSMDLAFVITGEEEEPEPGVKWEQLPDLADTGIDVDITMCGPAADDFRCTATGPITDVHIWGSWFYDSMPFGDPTAIDFFIEIWSDNPMGPSGYSEPNEPLWWWDFPQGTFTASIYAQGLYEGYYIPCEFYEPFGDTMCWQYDFYIDPCDAFIQEAGNIYWLLVGAMPHDYAYFGWKTSLDHWNDDAVTPNMYPPPEWSELRYPVGYGHPLEGQSMDLAFAITTEPEEKKPFIEHSKWSQPPIEIDPTSEIPVFSGWDEPSFRETILGPAPFPCWDIPRQCHGDADGLMEGDSKTGYYYVGDIDLAILLAAYPPNPYDHCADYNRDFVIDNTDQNILSTWYKVLEPAIPPIPSGPGVPPNCPPEGGGALEEYWNIVADDFRCLGDMPVTSIHWWGSYFGWEQPGGMPSVLPTGWKICFWSNVPADPTGGDPNYSYPEVLLWQVDIDAHRVEIDEVGTDSYHGYFPNDVCYQYNLQLEPNEWFWQGDFEPNTIDNVFWLSIAAIYEPNEFSPYPWGWKTRPWHWMDDAVRFWFDGPLLPGMMLDPHYHGIYPLEDPLYQESVDVAFELDTDPNWIKWEQYYCGIRQWPHYEDVPSDVAVWPDGLDWLQAVADDWPCDNNRPITALAWWGSYLDYQFRPCSGEFMPLPDPPDYFWISIWTDVPADPNVAGSYSQPGEMIWDYPAYDYDEVLVGYDKHPEYDPCAPREPVFRYSVRLPEEEWFWQEEDEAVYWLMIVAAYEQRYPMYIWGWTLHEHVYNDDAVYGEPIIDDEQWLWYEVLDQTGASADMSFILYTDPNVEQPPPPELDFGDANDPPYPTLSVKDGARHVIGYPLWLGPADDMPDPEPDGQPDPQALGDDNDGNDDEDGVTIPTLTQGIPTTITVEVYEPSGLGGVVELWIDFNGNGDWTDAGELVFSGMLGSGLNLIPVTAPIGSVVGQTFARCRISSLGTGSTTGLAPDGEVEDHEVTIEAGKDFGDAPPPYPTVGPAAARHIIVPGVMLGVSIDAELTGQPDATATGDDNDGNDDEDGVVFTSPLVAGQMATVDVTASVPGMLNAWIDFNINGNWADAGEQIFANQPLTGGGMTDNLNFNVPAAAVIGSTFARFRFDTTGGLSYTGQAADGEVEDYMVDIEEEVLIKWSQPPVEIEPGVYYGWDEPSIYGWLQIVADDWPCDNLCPVSEIHWWGSYYEWLDPMPPQPAPIGFHIGIWTDVPAMPPFVPWSHPGMMIWEYRATMAEVNEVFVGFDAHPHYPPDTCFKYELQLPEEMWFWQDPNENAIYWVSIAAIYNGPIPDMWYWGWKTREHYFMDDAVRIWMPTAPIPGDPFIEGEPIMDQNEVSWDMSFILFTESDCFPCCHPDYREWLAVNKPPCWCYPRQCHGDVDNAAEGGSKTGYNYVHFSDLTVMLSAWSILEPNYGNPYPGGPGIDWPDPNICADFAHDQEGGTKTGYNRVHFNDLTILLSSWNILEPNYGNPYPGGPGIDPNCLDCP